MTQSKPYLVQVRHTQDPRYLMVTIWTSESDRPGNGIEDFYILRMPEYCFTNEASPRLTASGRNFLEIVDPGIMSPTTLYQIGTVRMSHHRAKQLPELAEYTNWLAQYLSGYQSKS